VRQRIDYEQTNKSNCPPLPHDLQNCWRGFGSAGHSGAPKKILWLEVLTLMEQSS
jgi:hypothetical protein